MKEVRTDHRNLEHTLKSFLTQCAQSSILLSRAIKARVLSADHHNQILGFDVQKRVFQKCVLIFALNYEKPVTSVNTKSPGDLQKTTREGT